MARIDGSGLVEVLMDDGYTEAEAWQIIEGGEE